MLLWGMQLDNMETEGAKMAKILVFDGHLTIAAYITHMFDTRVYEVKRSTDIEEFLEMLGNGDWDVVIVGDPCCDDCNLEGLVEKLEAVRKSRNLSFKIVVNTGIDDSEQRDAVKKHRISAYLYLPFATDLMTTVYQILAEDSEDQEGDVRSG